MQDAGEEEDDDLCDGWWYSSPDKRRVDVAAHEVGDGLVPSGPVSSDGADVPPWAIELAVAEPHDLCEGIER